MSLTPEEQRALAIECRLHKGTARDFEGNLCYYVTDQELAAYTAAVEAKERERCKEACDKEAAEWVTLRDIHAARGDDTTHDVGAILSANRCSTKIASLK